MFREIQQKSQKFDLINKHKIHPAWSSSKNHPHGTNYLYLRKLLIIRLVERYFGHSITTIYDFTYTLFDWEIARRKFNVTTWPAIRVVDTTILCVDVSAPIETTLSTNRQICFRRKSRANPINLHTNIYAALLRLKDKIIDKIIKQLNYLRGYCVFRELARIFLLGTSESCNEIY